MKKSNLSPSMHNMLGTIVRCSTGRGKRGVRFDAIDMTGKGRTFDALQRRGLVDMTIRGPFGRSQVIDLFAFATRAGKRRAAELALLGLVLLSLGCASATYFPDTGEVKARTVGVATAKAEVDPDTQKPTAFEASSQGVSEGVVGFLTTGAQALFKVAGKLVGAFVPGGGEPPTVNVNVASPDEE